MPAKESVDVSRDAITIIGLGRAIEVAVNQTGVTPSQYRALWLVEAGMTSSSIIARFLDVRPPTVTTVMNGMVDAGWVERTRDPDDRRRVGYELTSAGLDTLHAASAAAAERLTLVAEELTASERRWAFEGLGLWRDAIDRRRARRHGSEEARS